MAVNPLHPRSNPYRERTLVAGESVSAVNTFTRRSVNECDSASAHFASQSRFGEIERY